MSGSGPVGSSAEVVAEPAEKPQLGPCNRSRLMETWRYAPEHVDAQERARQRNARRLALVLMAASCVVTILVIYGAWQLLHGLIVTAG